MYLEIYSRIDTMYVFIFILLMSRSFVYAEAISDFLSQWWHHSADQIYTYLQKEFPLLHKWTLYRNIDHLLKQKTIMKVEWISKSALYETYKPPHSHLFCRWSNTMYDLPYNIQIPQTSIPDNFVVEQCHAVVIWYYEGTACKTKSIQ